MAGFNQMTVNVCGEYRPCYVKGKKAFFHRWADVAYTVGESLMVGGPAAGQVAYTVAIVEMEDGEVCRARSQDIRFLDSAERFEGMYWPDDPDEHKEETNEES